MATSKVCMTFLAFYVWEALQCRLHGNVYLVLRVSMAHTCPTKMKAAQRLVE